MQKLFFYFVSLFIVFYACSEQEVEKSTHVANNEVEDRRTTAVEDRAPKTVEQAPPEDLVFPEAYIDFGIPMYNDAKITNNLMLSNTKGKFGQRLMLDCPGTLSDVFAYYDKSLKENGWEHDPAMDKERSDNDFEYRSVRYLKGGHLLLISLMDVKKGTVAVDQILKEI